MIKIALGLKKEVTEYVKEDCQKKISTLILVVLVRCGFMTLDILIILAKVSEFVIINHLNFTIFI